MMPPITPLTVQLLPRRKRRPALAARRVTIRGVNPQTEVLRRMEPTTLRLTDRISRSQTVPKAHLIGVCGTGMRALAELLLGLQWKVSGSDQQKASPAIQHFQREGLIFHGEHHHDNVPKDAQYVVYSPAIPAENSERLAATRLGIRQFSYTQMLGHLMEQRAGVCISGTHGKSTTTAMTGCILTSASRNPSVMMGAELCETGQSAWSGSGELFVVESCEFQRNFLNYHPRYAAILGVEADHVDCFETLSDLKQAFGAFAQQVQPDGVLLVRGDCSNAREAVQSAQARVVTFGSSPDADWWVDDLRRTSCGMRFRVYHQSQYFNEISLRLPGRHNVMNALAAAALCHEIGVGPREIRESLQDFGGIRRRFECIGQWRGVTMIDDYAHHPTAVQATLQTARDQYGSRKIWCAFQPHQVSRTQAFLAEFATSFDQADEVLISPVFAARESVTSEPETVSAELVELIRGHGQAARYCASLDQVIATLEDGLRPGDILITMGAGNIDSVHHAFSRRVSRHSTTRRAYGSVHVA